MAVTISTYNHTAQLIASQGVTLATLKVMLLDGTTAFDAAHTTKNQATDTDADEVDNGGWTTGGETLANVAASTVTTNDAKIDADDISVTATGSAIGPAEAALVYDSTSGKPLWHIDFGESKQADEGTAFIISWHSTGIVVITNAA